MPKGIYIRTEEHRKINSIAHIGISNNQKGLKRSKESRKVMSESRLRYYSIYSHPSKGKHFSDTVKKRMKLFQKGNIPWIKGKHLSQNVRQKIGLANSIALKGRKLNIEIKNKISQAIRGVNHPNWQGGKSYEIYPLGWNKTFKEQICKIPKIELMKRLIIHHKGLNKQNINPRKINHANKEEKIKEMQSL